MLSLDRHVSLSSSVPFRIRRTLRTFSGPYGFPDRYTRLLTRGVNLEAFWWNRYVQRTFGGDHWCGCVPSKLAIDDVANRVCPKYRIGMSYAATGPPKQLAIFTFRASRSIFARILSDKSVRFELTTRERIPIS